MTKKTKSGIFALISALLITIIMGCENLTITITGTNPNGYVYDTTTGSALSGATVTLTGIGTTRTYTDTTNSSGYYSFSSNVEYGKYEITASRTGYTFIKQIVEVSSDNSLPNIGGFESTGLVSGDITIVALWDRSFGDVDAHLTFPTTAVGTTSYDSGDFYNPLDAVSTGFLPNGTTGRSKVNKSNTSFLSNGAQIYMRNSSTSNGGPETIYISLVPTYSAYNGGTAYTSGTNDPSGLPAGSYSGVGVLEYYLDAPTSGTYLSSTTNLNTADPKVYVFNGTSQIAQYSLPTYTNIKRASVFRINVFKNSSGDEYFQFLSDIRTLNETSDIRSVGNNNPVVIKSKNRS